MTVDLIAEDTVVVDKRRKITYHLISYVELPEYLKDNEYILRYYRAEWPLKEAFLSLFRWHNETLNIWTHLIGFLLFLGLTIAHLGQVARLGDVDTRSLQTASAANTSHNPSNFLGYSNGSSTAPKGTRWPFFVSLGGSMFCLLSSSMCHLLICHSHRMKLLLLRLDYLAIAVMIVASFVPPIYYTFQCDPRWQIIYLTAMVSMGIFAVVTLLSTASVSSGAFRAFRAMFFIAMGLSGFVPGIHALFLNWGEPKYSIVLAYEVAMGLAYITGALIYVNRVPEKWKPGSFDLVGHSHQIFHVFVVAGALVHYAATLILLEWRDRVECNQ
ncbi:heptahelical transmembrane protein 1 [Cinnamomum micranthum f. kanehirae]|uniref:Heptahelical transmembrane protein 1 n=1 Tax=Cinnamomum micranthum f. kanehirae TaxID=337451 RepID=A0A3S3MM73_9MAGN|nr:heptahelical transmembrane protein 1 [Cinnamomum micranthum f. kanehirae]